MEPTRRFWAVAALGVAGAVSALLFGSVLWLGIPLGVGAWVLTDQVAFTNALTELSRTQPVTQSVARDVVFVDEPTTLQLTVADDATLLADLSATLSVSPPPAVTVADDTAQSLPEPGERRSLSVRVDVAGTYDIDSVTVHCRSHRGLFTETLPVGAACSLTGEPRVPRNIHIGTGGERIAIAAGEHDAQGGSGYEPGELREYLPGDPTNRIDWNATARLGEPYVREYEAESTRQTHLFVDTRAPMTEGPRGRAKLDHAREVGVWLTEYVASLGDPLALTIVDADRTSHATDADTGAAHYRRLRGTLFDLSSLSASTTARGSTAGPPVVRSGRDAELLADQLTDDTPFDRTLRPFVEHAGAYTEQVAGDPLFASVRSRLAAQSGDSWLVVLTDDTHRAEVFETTRMAASGDTHVSVFLLPSVLFDEQAFADLDAAYAAYRDFESFRQQLDAHPQVTAFEVGPGDRLASLIDVAQSGQPS